jgi:hypothetical protein
MELAAAAISLVDLTTRASTGIWKLCRIWKDTPRELIELRDDLITAKDFFSGVEHGITIEKSKSFNTLSDLSSKAIRELQEQLIGGQSIINEIQLIIDRLISGGISPDMTIWGITVCEPLNKRMKLLWITKRDNVLALRKNLKEVRLRICASLMCLNM